MRLIIRENAKRCLMLLISPIARFCITHSIGFREFSEMCKAVFVETAKQRLAKTGVPPSASRISLMTGLQRRDITSAKDAHFINEAHKENLLTTRIIGQWSVDPRFLDKRGKPKILKAVGKNSEFAELVRSVSIDPNPYSVLFDLERVGAVERTKRGVRLVLQTFIPRADLVSGYELLASDCNDLITAVEENLLGDPPIRNLHSTTSFDNIDPRDLPHIRKFLLRYGASVHSKVRSFLSKFDRDTHTSLKGTSSVDGASDKSRARIAFSTFSIAEDLLVDPKKKDRDEY